MGGTGLTGNIYAGLDEFEDLAFLLHVLREEDLFVDIGANAGSYTILGCSAVGARGYAIEPVPRTFERLVYNVRLNRIENSVKCLNIAIGAHAGDAVFSSNLDTTNRVLVERDECENTIEVKVLPLDDVMACETPALLKIDVEGFEKAVLDGAERVLDDPILHSVIIELNGSGGRYGFDENEIMEGMLARGFRPYSYEPFGRQLIELQGANQERGNTLLVRNKGEVEKKLKRAPPFNVHGRKV